MVRLLSRPCQQNPTCALTLLHMSSGAQPWPSASVGSLSGGVRLAGLRCVCVCMNVKLPIFSNLLSECSPWQPRQWVLVPTSGLSCVQFP